MTREAREGLRRLSLGFPGLDRASEHRLPDETLEVAVSPWRAVALGEHQSPWRPGEELFAELTSGSHSRPSAVRPALALTAAEEVETIRRVLLEAATSTARETWASCTCPECGKSFRQEISVPDHGARIKAIETLLREGLGRVGEADVPTPRMPSSVAEVEAMSWDEMKFVFAISHAQAIRAVVDHGIDALRLELERWEPKARASVARALAEVC